MHNRQKGQSELQSTVEQTNDEIRQIIKRVQTDLKQFQMLSKKERQQAQESVYTLNVHVKELLLTVHFVDKAKPLLNRVTLEANRIVIRYQLADVADLIINRISYVPLTNIQQSSVIHDVKMAEHYVDQSINDASTVTMIRDAYVRGVNSINGDLSKYVLDSRINASDNVLFLMKKAKQAVDQKFTDNNIRAIAKQEINQIGKQAVPDLKNSANFVQLTQYYQKAKNQFDEIASDQQRHFHAIVSFDNAVHHAKLIVNKLSLSTKQRQVLNNKIIKRHQQMLKQISSIQYHDINVTELISVEHQINSLVSKQVAKHADYALRLKVIKKAKLKAFNKAFDQIIKQLKDQKVLANAQVRKSRDGMYSCYHKTIGKIKDASKIRGVIKNERDGYHKLKNVLKQATQLNIHKQKIFDSVKKEIRDAREQITQLKYLQIKDKQASNTLLKQTQQQTFQLIQKSTNKEQLLKVRSQSRVTMKQIIDDFMSADVFLAAVQSADDRINKSSLNNVKKQRALQKFHEIIKIGLKIYLAKHNQNPKN